MQCRANPFPRTWQPSQSRAGSDGGDSGGGSRWCGSGGVEKRSGVKKHLQCLPGFHDWHGDHPMKDVHGRHIAEDHQAVIFREVQRNHNGEV